MQPLFTNVARQQRRVMEEKSIGRPLFVFLASFCLFGHSDKDVFEQVEFVTLLAEHTYTPSSMNCHMAVFKSLFLRLLAF